MVQTILVVEDDESLRRLFLAILPGKKYNVLVAKDELEGLQLAIAQKPDLILSDIEMPRLNSHSPIDKLQQNLDLAMIPVILISGLAIAAARNYALQLGAADFLSKPALPDTILGTLSKCLRSSI